MSASSYIQQSSSPVHDTESHLLYVHPKRSPVCRHNGFHMFDEQSTQLFAFRQACRSDVETSILFCFLTMPFHIFFFFFCLCPSELLFFFGARCWTNQTENYFELASSCLSFSFRLFFSFSFVEHPHFVVVDECHHRHCRPNHQKWISSVPNDKDRFVPFRTDLNPVFPCSRPVT